MREGGWIASALLAIAGCTFSHSLSTSDSGSGSGGGDPEAGAPIDMVGPEATPPAACLSSAVYNLSHGSHTYRALPTTATYDVQTDACAKDGAHLVTIDDASEDTFVSGAVTSGWIGLDDLTSENALSSPAGTATKFAWQFPAIATYTNWNNSEPNDSNGAEDCVYTDANQNQTWNDDDCSHSRGAVCECEPNVPVHPHPMCMDLPGVLAGGRKYIAVQGASSATWDVARVACENIGAYLFTPGDANENDFIGKGNPIDVEMDVWIGYADTATIGQFRWENGAPNGFESWATNEPSAETTSSCVTMHETGNSSDPVVGLWANHKCSETHPYVCECDPWPP